MSRAARCITKRRTKDLLITCSMVLFVARAGLGDSLTDGTTPLGVGQGGPLGSYALSGLETINLYSGRLGFALPLCQVRGRGEAQYWMTVPIAQTWRVDYTPLYNLSSATPNWWNGIRPGYAPAVLIGRTVTDGGCSPNEAVQSLTRLTLINADGTEIELRDQLTGGGKRETVCAPSPPYVGPSRGRVFVTADGSAATFVSTTEIRDDVGSSSGYMYPSGYLWTRDGIRYEISVGRVMTLRDRNGNQLTFGHDE